MKFFKVTVKFGHCGRGFFLPGDLYITALSGKEAAKKGRNTPRVKHDHQDAILNVVEISEVDYEEGIAKNRENLFF